MRHVGRVCVVAHDDSNPQSCNGGGVRKADAGTRSKCRKLGVSRQGCAREPNRILVPRECHAVLQRLFSGKTYQYFRFCRRSNEDLLASRLLESVVRSVQDKIATADSWPGRRAGGESKSQGCRAAGQKRRDQPREMVRGKLSAMTW